ncbi:hypothetical protein [Asaia astilbis]|nr:hypothetical protein [Asaia astilbis]
MSRSQDVQSTSVQAGPSGISHASLPLLGDRSIQTALSAHLASR